MRWIDRPLLLCAIGILAPLGAAHAELTVIADHGGQTARPYYAPIASSGVDESQAYSARAEARSEGPITEADMLPVTSDRLSPGPVSARTLDMPAGMSPFFLIGADGLSQRWLKQRGPRLRELHAVGLVVDVQTPAQLTQLRQAGNGLILRPAAGNDIAQRLHLSHYPALITHQGIQQ